MTYQALLQALATKPAEVRADFVGHLAFRLMGAKDLSRVPADMKAALDQFIVRAGLLANDTPAGTVAKLDAHFGKHPPDKSLMALFDGLVATVATQQQSAQAKRGSDAQRWLGSAASSVPVGAQGRQPASMGGGVLGMMAAKTAASAVASASRMGPHSKQPTMTR